VIRKFSPRSWWFLGAVNGALVVALGAIGAHMVSAEQVVRWQTAVHYHMFHVMALFAVGMAAAAYPRSAVWSWVGGLFTIGILLFCGSLYVMSLGYPAWRSVAPIGGAAFIAGWVVFAIALLRAR
jgi:uncharacterized membrane protein YgdD (TMEM256/DUF423 family)